ncbi:MULTISPECIES: PepSY domain-containing protein [unclassified Novosphingobium]|uniref:PepSY-associated TM helix domain-containing protein n=1 Tax=unclassified Novosphingobium TaxID=2644732 RepID=UPI001494688E|nr:MULTISPECIES: PepSY domain-containing protein [unclassified Novosphingobium]MBB3360507.1 putative iron-regulated membrane protein [Novosphingobium sp. BK256]MBB3376889.1 putative iron-regulated membrane protein [Novosphingobium sp. BK280]MBB3381237.1 putative iron-regulated membrane protein [Novosphingobium sp. BK258]MBB3422951.1 putative iron-regulated membrane protein [Novosphingobium sp. BK267]MBB3451653.1 putative iron-regulated membrane protein [Novosphingobium sp. BK352]
MKPATLRAWSKVHTWSSLTCTLFLLILTLTGLPLIFHDEIDGLSKSTRPEHWSAAELLPVDRAMAAALARHPGSVPIYLSFDEDRPVINLTTGPTGDAPEAAMQFNPIDLRTATPPHGDAPGHGVMDTVLDLHKDLLLGKVGEYFLGAMGLCFALALVSGVVLYAPFARKPGFATVRRGKSNRLRWLDWHNVIGGVTLAWAMVVGLTGTINTLADPITAWWRGDALARLAHDSTGPIVPYRPGIAALALRHAQAAVPGMTVQFVAFPGAAFSSHDHIAVYLKGATPLTAKLLTPVMVDARTGQVDGVAPMPWYMKGLLLAQPLHFGDYGGLAMKILWALLDLVSIVVLGSGLYLWLGKPRPARKARAA